MLDSTLKTAKTLAGEYIEALDKRHSGERRYLHSGFASLEKASPAWLHEGHLIIVAGRPAMGKSAFAQQVAENIAEAGKSVLVFTLEMSGYELTERSVSRRSGIPIPRLKITEALTAADWSLVGSAMQDFGDLPLVVDDVVMDIKELVAKSQTVAANLEQNGMPPLGCVLVDYLQLVNGSSRGNATREAEVSSVSKALKQLAKQLHIPVIALSQLNRGVEGRVGKRPTMSDLRESGAIEQDADLIMFLYRDEYYNPETTNDPGVAEVIVAKNRHGATGKTKLAFIAERVRFGDLAP